MSRRLFLAAPFTQWLTDDGSVNTDHRRELQAIRDRFHAHGFDVFLAHEREAWGRELMTPLQCTPLDLEEMRRSDVVVAIPGSSGGVHVEIGWATAHGKPLILWLEKSRAYSPLVIGATTITRATTIEYQPSAWEDAMQLSLEWIAVNVPHRTE